MGWRRVLAQYQLLVWQKFIIQMEVPNISHGQVTFPPYQPLEALRDSSTRPLSELMVLYTPNTSKDAEDIMKKAGNKLGIPLQGFPTEDEMVESYLTSPQQAITVGAVTFQSINPYGEIIFKVRPKATPAELKNDTLSQLEKIWFTDYVYSLMILNYPRHFLNSYGAVPTYAESGFLALQESVTSAIIEWKYEKIRISRPQLNVKYLLKRFPYPPFIVDTFLPNCMLYLPVFIIFSFLYPNVIAVWNIVQEKETRVEEAMKIMGLISWVNWLAIFTKELAIFSFNSLIITAILKIQFRAESSVFRYSDFSLIFVILLTYSICTISLSFLISAFFSSSSTAAAASGVVFLINFLPYFMIISNYSKWSYVGIVAICILPNTAISMIFKLLTSWEGNGEGAQWHLISQTPIFGDPMNIRVILQTMIIDSVVCLVLALYINEVFPRKYAYYKSLFFPFHFLRKYIHKEGPEEFMETLPLDDERFESEPASVPGIKCVGLTKSYGERISVNNLYLNCHMGQITVLLGHNGAGKTTTMSMITGMISPTYGTVFINTYNIKTHVGKIRSNLGICPQYNVLFDNLTVYDHLYFFRKLKICSNENLKEDIDIMIQRLDLENKRNSFPRMLSGGMKRKLSIGNALIGDPSVVLLDEPSSGMDPSARRFIWDLLTEEKKGRTILLTTQFMEEADILGDRIAIMDRGMIQCCGSPLFLKKQYGVGYHMVLVKDISCDTQIVLKAVQNFVSNAEIESNMGQELSITLPTDSVIKFESLFTYLEENKKELGIQSYGASVTTLEEVFLKVGEHAMSKMKYIRGEELRAFEEVRLNNQMKRDLLSTNIIRGIRLKWRHFRTLAWKKFLFVKRHIMMTFIQQILPSILIIISFSSLIDLSDLSKVVPLPSTSTCLIIPMHPTFSTTQPSLNSLLKTIYRKSTRLKQYLNPSTIENILRLMNTFYIQLEQHLCGVKIVNYWSSTLLVDLLLYNLASFIQAVCVMMFQKPGLSSFSDFMRLIVVYCLCGFAGIPSVYILSQFYNDSTSAYIQIFFILVSTGIGSLLAVFVTGMRDFNLKWSNNLLDNVCSGYTVGLTLTELTIWKRFREVLRGAQATCKGCAIVSNPIEDYVDEDVDVLREKDRILGSKLAEIEYTNPIIFHKLSKCYGNFTAVNELCLGIKRGEIFGLLGINGAGKSSTFKMIAGDEPITSGDIYIEGKSIKQEPSWIYSKIGYCPQYDALLETMTGRETMIMYGQIKGLPRVEIEEQIDNLSKVLYFEKHLNKLVRNYSGGSKRKLSTAIALMGDPPIILLDEPSSGMDPVARRCLWDSLLSAQNRGCSIILTSHSMEEWSSQYLKNKYSEGFTLGIKVSPPIFLSTDPPEERDKKRVDFIGQIEELKNYIEKIPGEIFGLLGVNGAGKSTIFKMLTGDLPISSGDAYIVGVSVKTNPSALYSKIGYCPQYDAILDTMTGREALFMYGKLKGMTTMKIEDQIFNLSRMLYFEHHLDKIIKYYSGGNKRKLSSAIALIGYPPVVFLDEPSSGMDPIARRCLWETLLEFQKRGCSILLTSHSMEECEVLCNRLVIMVNGHFCCLGPPQHLKNKYREGFTLGIKLSHPVIYSSYTKEEIESKQAEFIADIEEFKDYIEDLYPNAILKAAHCGFLQYHIKSSSLKWGALFGSLERAKLKFNIEDYSLSQTTLEQIFLSLAKAQK
ncbi:ABCA3 [Cordylochernes scorpioides]|uniref:ABCA3 n=1 Tax=Cordylochernes scorpioides TaxID=51811 RepID=A0ABY6K2M0_9ARAC|nr:ABCA3 [Cordylochernes scorpioides]